MQRFAGKVVLVTGAASGLGAAIADRLEEESATVARADLSETCGYALDVRSETSWQDAIAAIEDRHGRLDILVNNAGVGLSASVDEMTFEEWRQVQSVNLDGVFLGIRTAAPAMRRAGGGVIVNIASIMGQVAGAGSSAYCASKSGVLGLTRATALDLAPAGIRVVALQPGFVETPLLASRLEADSKRRDALETATPAARLGESREIAAAVAYLASDEAAFIVGSSLVIDGGYTLR